MAVPTLSASAGYDAGKPAVGPTVRSDLEAIQTEMDGNIDGDNIKDGVVINAKLGAGSVTTDKIASNGIREANVLFGETGSGVLAPRIGPNYNSEGGTNSAPRLAMVSKEVTWGGTTPDSVTFTYATDCIDGDPGFSALPHLLGEPVVASVEVQDAVFTTYRVTASSASAITMEFAYGGASTATVQIEFGVMGAMS